jgi:hypothetical protein
MNTLRHQRHELQLQHTAAAAQARAGDQHAHAELYYGTCATHLPVCFLRRVPTPRPLHFQHGGE